MLPSPDRDSEDYSHSERCSPPLSGYKIYTSPLRNGYNLPSRDLINLVSFYP